MCLRLSARRILQRYASNLANLVSSDKIRHVFIPSYQYRYASSYWLFCRWFLWKMQNIWRPGFLSKEIPASLTLTADRVTNGMTERERCQTEASLSWKKPPVVLRAIKLYCAWTEMITKPISPTWPLSNMPHAFSTLSKILNEWICSIFWRFIGIQRRLKAH